MNKLTLKIGGMSCNSCARLIEHSLKKENGVVSAEIDFKQSQGAIKFNPEQTQTGQMVKIVKDLGYSAEIINA